MITDSYNLDRAEEKCFEDLEMALPENIETHNFKINDRDIL